MSIGAILTLGLGSPFGRVNLLPTLGYLSGAPTVAQSTPGRILRPLGQIRVESEADKKLRRIAEGSLPADAPPTDHGRLAEYTEKSALLAKAVGRLRGETEQYQREATQLRAAIERLREQDKAKLVAKAERDLMLKEQALTLAAAQQAALLEEMEMIDVAYVAMIALSMVMQ